MTPTNSEQATERLNDCLDAIANLQFLHHISHIVFNGFLAELQSPGDLFVGQAQRHLTEDFLFAGSKVRDAISFARGGLLPDLR